MVEKTGRHRVPMIRKESDAQGQVCFDAKRKGVPKDQPLHAFRKRVNPLRSEFGTP